MTSNSKNIKIAATVGLVFVGIIYYISRGLAFVATPKYTSFVDFAGLFFIVFLITKAVLKFIKFLRKK